jgi:hypothetical protein
VARHRPLLAGSAAVALPLIPLAWIHATFAVDWYNHLWLIGYFGEFFRIHHRMPEALNAQPTLLIAYPTFYGYLLYSVLGLPGTILSPSVVVRSAVVCLWAIRFVLTYLAARALMQQRLIPLTIACLVSWETYALTNLYNRSALTELFATGLLTSVLCLLILIVRTGDSRVRAGYTFAAGIAVSLGAMSHPITALFGALFLTPLCSVAAAVAVSTPHARRDVGRLAASLLSVVVFGLLVSAPWVYATMSFSSVLKISSKESLAAVALFPHSIDAVLSRFSPIPLDTRSLAKGLAVSTPYLDAQVNMPLLLLLAFMIGAGYSRTCRVNGSVARLQSDRAGTILLWTSVALFAVATVASLSAKVYGYAPGLRIIQFPYRMVTYQNLALLAATFAQLLRIRCDTSTSQWCVVLTACLTLAATGVMVKFAHVFAVMKTVDQRMPYRVDPADPSEYLRMPRTFYGPHAYTLNTPVRTPAQQNIGHVSFEVGKGTSFGVVQRRLVTVDAPTWVTTNVALSPWNEILIDGTRAVLHTFDGVHAALRVPAGTHVAGARFAPDQTFVVLRRLSNSAFLLWVCGAAVWCLSPITRRTQVSNRSGRMQSKP